MKLNVAGLRGRSRLWLLPALVLLGCAPLMTMQPPIPMQPNAATELGFAAGASQVVIGHCYGCFPLYQQLDTGLVAQAWFRHQVSDSVRLGFLASAGHAFAVSGGFDAQIDLFQGKAAGVSLDLQCGWYWCAVGIPVAYRPQPGVWLYGAGYGAVTAGGDITPRPIVRVPLGVALRVSDQALFLGEVSGVWRPSFVGEGWYDNHVLVLVAGIGFAFRV